MVFSYDTYWEVVFFIPIIVITFIFSLVLTVSFSCLKKAKEQNKRKIILNQLFSVIFLLLCAIPSLVCLANGGVLLARDSEDATIVKNGIIEDVCEPTTRFPGFKSSHKYGADIVIDGELYFAITAGDFEVGDIVEIRYLPYSHFILSISADEG